MAVEWIWLIFIFAMGGCVGSFLNVVIYRLPLDKSLVHPRSSCPSCDTLIPFYDNIPMISWLILRGKCRKCGSAISIRYLLVELLTAVMFIAVYLLYFFFELRSGMGTFAGGGWFIYLIHICMLSALLAASAIDLELWVIPLSICWFVTAVGLAGSAISGFVIDHKIIEMSSLFPTASAAVSALSVGAAVGLVISLVLLACGAIKRSYESEGDDFNHRAEMLREIVFLLPIIACALLALFVHKSSAAVGAYWGNFSQIPVISRVLGSVWGYFIGGAIVWVIRILGTLGFGKEAMGLGDVHLMGAAGAVLGPVPVVAAFFVAPFFGLLGWAIFQMFFKKIRQIPFGPSLSLGLFAVMIGHDKIMSYLDFLFLR